MISTAQVLTSRAVGPLWRFVQVLRARCEADIHVELFSQETGGPADVSGIEVQVCNTKCEIHTVFRGQGLGGL